jgi:hypothetical protein
MDIDNMSAALESVKDTVVGIAEKALDVGVYAAEKAIDVGEYTEQVVEKAVVGVPNFIAGIPGGLKVAYNEVTHPAQFVKDIKSEFKNVQEEFKSIVPRLKEYGQGLVKRVTDEVEEIKTNTLGFADEVESRISGYPDESFYQSVSNASAESTDYKDINVLEKAGAFFIALPKNIPSKPYDIFDYFRRFAISGETLYIVMKIVSVGLLALLFYLVYTTYQMTALISPIPAFSLVSSANTNLSYIATISCLFYLLIFLYLLRSSSDNYNTEVVRYFFNVNLILLIMMSTFLDKILTNLSTINYNTVQDNTTIPQVTSIQSTQASIHSLITTITVVVWIFTNLISVICDVSQWGLDVVSIL